MKDVGQIEENRAAEPVLGGYLPSILTIAGALFVYFFAFEILVDPFSPTGTPPEVKAEFLWEGENPAPQVSVLAADLTARYRFGVPSALMTLAFIAALIVAFGLVLPRYGRGAVALGLLSLPAGAILGYLEQYANPLRNIVADCTPDLSTLACPLDQAVLRASPGMSFNSDILAQVRFLVSLNSMMSVAAIALVGICAMFIARTAPASQLDPRHLAQRRIGLETMLMVVGLLLALSVATTHGFYHLASALMHPPAANAYQLLGSAGTTYWGAVYSTVLIVLLVPALISVTRDGRRASVLALPNGSFSERLEWRKREGVEVSVRDKFGLALTSFAPVLTTPVLDLVRKSLIV